MKPEQALIDIADELHKLNRKFDKIIDILSETYKLEAIRLDPNRITIAPYNPGDPNKITITPYNPANPYEITCATGNPEAHDYGVGYLKEETE